MKKKRTIRSKLDSINKNTQKAIKAMFRDGIPIEDIRRVLCSRICCVKVTNGQIRAYMSRHGVKRPK